MAINREVRIIDKPEVEEPEDNDYVLIDSETEGTRCISVRNLMGGTTNE